MEVTTRRTFTREMLPRLGRQQQALFAISRMWRQYEGDFTRAVREITETAARAIEIERVSVWRYDGVKRTIRCCDLFEVAHLRHSSGAELAAEQFPAYFEALEGEEIIAAEDALADPRTREFSRSYLQPNGIGAMLDAPIRVGGRLAGVLCHEHVGGPRYFHTHEVNAATYLANMLAAAMEFQQHAEREIEAKRSLSLLRAAFEASGAALIAVNDRGQVFEHNQRAIELWRLTRELIQSSDPLPILEHMASLTVDSDAFVARMQTAGAADDESRDVFELKDGRFIECTSQPQRLDEHVIGRVWSFRDVTDKHRMENRLRELAVRDPLTALSNRRHIEETLVQETKRAERSGVPLSIALIDIDHFKAVNDTLGHAVGDKVLCVLAADLQQRLRATDHVGRWGGEEFLVVLSGTALEGAAQVIDELRQHVARDREGLPCINISAGVAEFCNGDTADRLLREADVRLYKAKDRGRNRVVSK